jgi:hypothetical protein
MLNVSPRLVEECRIHHCRNRMVTSFSSYEEALRMALVTIDKVLQKDICGSSRVGPTLYLYRYLRTVHLVFTGRLQKSDRVNSICGMGSYI